MAENILPRELRDVLKTGDVAVIEENSPAQFGERITKVARKVILDYEL